jgi:hypothetical protein
MPHFSTRSAVLAFVAESMIFFARHLTRLSPGVGKMSSGIDSRTCHVRLTPVRTRGSSPEQVAARSGISGPSVK